MAGQGDSENGASRRRIDISRPVFGEHEIQAIAECLHSGWVAQGPQVARFEEAFAAYHQVEYAVATSSGTSALHLVFEALGVGPGDEVIVPAFTWVATANAVVYSGATPVFADVHPGSFDVDPARVAACLSERTRAVVAVHQFGLCADMESLRAVLPEGVALVEDAACAAGARERGRPAGGLGTAAAFSFHPRKPITTGEGGMLTTNDAELAERARRLRTHGASTPARPYALPDFDELGFNYRMTDLQAALGIVQLSKLDAFREERARWARHYREQLAGLGWLTMPNEPPDRTHAWQSFVTRVDPQAVPGGRDRLMAELDRRGVATRPGTHAIPTLGYYRRRFGLSPQDYPTSLDHHENSLAIPLHNAMEAEDYAWVIACLRELG